MSDRLRLTNAALLSMLLHAAAISLIGLVRQVGPSAPVLPALVDVDVITLPAPAPAAPVSPPAAPPVVTAPAPEPPAPALPKAQIVSPPDAGKEEPPKETRFLSDRDVTVERQTIRRGEGSADQTAEAPKARVEAKASRGGAAKRQTEPSTAGAPPAPPPQVGAIPGLEELLPKAGQLAREGYGETGESGDTATTESEKPERRDVLRFADAGRPGRRGTLDFIPDVQEGDITLLNTKAERFAPFVRRVAQRVFQTQVISLRRDLPHAAISAQESVTVEAIMNRRGNLVSVQITDRSSTASTGLDRHLQRACHQAFFDLNPPAGAEAADGNIHFLFRTQIEVFVAPNGLVGYGGLLTAGLL